MALQKFHKTYYTDKAKRYGVPETHPLLQRIKRGDESAARELDSFFQSKSESPQPYNAYTDQDIGAKKYGMDALKGFSEPEGSFLYGKPGWKEQVPLNTPEQQEYMNNALRFASERMPQLYDQMGQRANGGLLTAMFGNNASQGFENLIGQLGNNVGEYLPTALASGAGAALGGGGLGGILQALISSAAGQYASKNAGQSPFLNNISSGIGDYYNQGIGALGNLFNNRR